jgi:signal transduction histidine kinase
MELRTIKTLRAFGRADRNFTEHRLRPLAAAGLMTPGIAGNVANMPRRVSSVPRIIDRRIAYGSSEELVILTDDGPPANDRAAALPHRLRTFGHPGLSIRSRVDVNRLLRDLAPLLRLALGSELVLDLALAAGPLETWCDPRDLANAVINLAVNAREATSNPGGFDLRTFRANLPLNLPGLLSGDYVIIAAHDSGRGMPPDVMARAFDPLFTTKAAGDGFGMGLTSVKAFVEDGGGVADITSGPGDGTTVRLYLPLVRPETPRR